MFNPGDRVVVTTSDFDGGRAEEDRFQGKIGTVKGYDRRWVNVQFDDGPFPFVPDEVAAAPFEIGETVLVNSPRSPMWNGEARFDGYGQIGATLTAFVTPIEGEFRGWQGGFSLSELAKCVEELPEWEQELLNGAPAAETHDELRAAAARLEELAELAAEASAYANALADTLDKIEASVLS